MSCSSTVSPFPLPISGFTLFAMCKGPTHITTTMSGGGFLSEPRDSEVELANMGIFLVVCCIMAIVDVT